MWGSGLVSRAANIERVEDRCGAVGQVVRGRRGTGGVCPWHSWTFNVKTGLAEYPVHERVDVFPMRVEGEDVLVDIE